MKSNIRLGTLRLANYFL